MTHSVSLQQLLDSGLAPDDARSLLPQINIILSQHPAQVAWQQLTQKILRPYHPFAFHQLIYHKTYRYWEDTSWDHLPCGFQISNVSTNPTYRP